MKIIKIFFLTLFIVLVLVGITVFVLLKTVDLNRFKPRIESQLSELLNRQVRLGQIHLGFSFTQGLRVDLADLSVQDEEAFAKEDFLTVKNISAGVDVKALLGRKVVVSDIVISSCRLAVIRNRDGRINVQSIGPRTQAQRSDLPGSLADAGQGSIDAAAASGGAVSAGTKNDGDSASAQSALPDMVIKSIRLSDSTIVYIDRQVSPAINVEISRLQAQINDFAFARAVPFTLGAAVVSAEPDVWIKGALAIDPVKILFTLSSLEMKSDLSKIDPAMLRAALPMIGEAPLPENVKGEVSLLLDKAEMGAAGLSSLAAKGKVSSVSFSLKGLKEDITQLSADFALTEKDLTFDPVSLRLGDGSVKANASLSDYTGRQEYRCQATLADVQVQRVVDQGKQPVKLEGKLSGKFSVAGKGFDPATMAQSLSGDGNIELKEGTLKDINVLKMVLDKITIIPGLSEKIAQSYPEKLSAKDTPLNKTEAQLSLSGGSVQARQVQIDADGFAFNGQTEANLSQDFTVSGEFSVSKELSAKIIDAVSEMQYLANQDGCIYFPLKVSGSLASMKFGVDLEYIGKKMVVQQGALQLQKLLEKTVKKDETSSSESTTTQSQEQSPEQKIIQDIFKKIF